MPAETVASDDRDDRKQHHGTCERRDEHAGHERYFVDQLDDARKHCRRESSIKPASREPEFHHDADENSEPGPVVV